MIAPSQAGDGVSTGPSRRELLARRPLLVAGALCLVLAMVAGLSRLGWHLGLDLAGLEGAHGTLMVVGFLGTVVSLERAAALRRLWTYGPPVLAAAAALTSLLPTARIWPPLLGLAAAAGFTLVCVRIYEGQRALHTATLAVAAACWFGGGVLWLQGRPLFDVVPWWIAFIVLTIAGERLELTRFQRMPSWSRWAFGALVALQLVGLLLALRFPGHGGRVAGVAWLALAIWLGRFDMARRNVRRDGLQRFIAVCLLTGYVWLALAGVLAITEGQLIAGPIYDAMVHAVFVGFAFSMIFGHAPIIFPAVVGRPVPYTSLFYGHLALLHASVTLRVVADLLGLFQIRLLGGALNVAAILLFLGMTAGSVIRGGRSTAVGTGATGQ